jgi:hypothetical protein
LLDIHSCLSETHKEEEAEEEEREEEEGWEGGETSFGADADVSGEDEPLKHEQQRSTELAIDSSPLKPEQSDMYSHLAQ